MNSVRDYPQMKIRLSPELKALIEEAAKANTRTLNAEITARLEQSFKQDNYEGIERNELKQILREIIHEVVEYQSRHFESWLDRKISGEIPARGHNPDNKDDAFSDDAFSHVHIDY